jgi:ornithine cyclodeaminase
MEPIATQQKQHVPRIYALEDIEKVTSLPSFQGALIEAISNGFVAFSNNKFSAAAIQTMGAPPLGPFVVAAAMPAKDYAAQTCVKSGYFQDNPYYVIKVGSGGTPWENAGLMQVYSQSTGRLAALLLDDGVLTELRTAAVGALAAKMLAPKPIRRIGIVGTGVQARYQLQMLEYVTDCREVLVWGRSAEKVDAYIHEMKQKGWLIKKAETADELLLQCELVVTTTNAREPVLGTTGVVPPKGALITCIGSDAPGKMELDVSLVVKASILVADNPPQSQERGEFQSVLGQGKKMLEQVVPLGQICQSKEFHRVPNDESLIIFDSSGVALQDCVVAQMVYEALINSEGQL